MKAKVKSSKTSEPNQTQLLLALAKIVEQLQEKVESLSENRSGPGLIVTLAKRAGLDGGKTNRGRRRANARRVPTAEKDSDTVSDREAVTRKRKKSKSTKHRIEAESENVVVSLPGLKLNFNVSDGKRPATTTMLK